MSRLHFAGQLGAFQTEQKEARQGVGLCFPRAPCVAQEGSGGQGRVWTDKLPALGVESISLLGDCGLAGLVAAVSWPGYQNEGKECCLSVDRCQGWSWGSLLKKTLISVLFRED